MNKNTNKCCILSLYFPYNYNELIRSHLYTEKNCGKFSSEKTNKMYKNKQECYNFSLEVKYWCQNQGFQINILLYREAENSFHFLEFNHFKINFHKYFCSVCTRFVFIVQSEQFVHMQGKDTQACTNFTKV